MNFISKAVNGFKKAVTPVAIALGLSVPTANLAIAATISFEYETTIGSTVTDPVNAPVPTYFANFSDGDNVSVLLSFDTDTNIGSGLFTNIDNGATTSENYTTAFFPTFNTLTLSDDNSNNGFILQANGGSTPLDKNAFALNVEDNGVNVLGAAIADDIFNVLVLESFNGSVDVTGAVRNEMPAVPAPAALPMMLLGLGALGVVAARRRKLQNG